MNGGSLIDRRKRMGYRRLKQYVYATGLLACLMFHACAPKKHLASREVPGEWKDADRAARLEFFKQLHHYQLGFNTVNARAKGFLTINDKENHEVDIQLRMREGEAIWVSVTAFLGMEVGRLLLTPDSIRVINRMDGDFMTKPYGAIRTLIGQELSFGELQHLLVGNVPDSAKALEMDLGVFREGGVLRSAGLPPEELQFNQNFRLVTFITDGPRMPGPEGSGPALETNHAYRAGRPGHPGFPEKTSITVRGPRVKLTVTMEYNRLVLDQPVELPFNIPKGYTQIH